jgi:hypothetical protein
MKLIIACLLGALLGGGTTALIIDRVNKSKWPELEDDKDVPNPEHIWTPMNKDNGSFTRELKGYVDPGLDKALLKGKPANLKTDSIDYTKFDRRKLERPNLSDLAAKYAEKEDTTPYAGKDTNTEPGPHIITYEQYQMGDPAGVYEQVELTFYDLDKVLVDENLEIFKDRDSAIGEKALESFGQDQEDPDIVHIRNNSLLKDYEIVRVPKSYSEDVMGIPFQKPAPKKSKKNPPKAAPADETSED